MVIEWKDPEMQKISSFLNLKNEELFKKVKSRKDLLKLPILALWGVNEKVQHDFEFTVGYRTIEELAGSTLSTPELVKRTGVERSRLQIWLVAARLIASGLPQSELETKFLMLGLDNAGKTAIIKTVTRLQNKISRRQSDKEILELEPTRGVERKSLKFLDYAIPIHDHGGQQNYREMYLRNPERFFPGTAVVFFVIDIWDSDRYDEAFDYLRSISSTFEYLSMNPLFIILLHKADPVRRNELMVKQQVTLELLKANLATVPAFTRRLPRIEFSSIYDEERLFRMFADTIREFSPVVDVINQIANELVTELEVDALLLMTGNGFELAHGGIEGPIQTVLQQLALDLIETDHALKDHGVQVKSGFLTFEDSLHYVSHRFPGILEEEIIFNAVWDKGLLSKKHIRKIHSTLERKMAPLIRGYLNGGGAIKG